MLAAEAAGPLDRRGLSARVGQVAVLLERLAALVAQEAQTLAAVVAAAAVNQLYQISWRAVRAVLAL